MEKKNCLACGQVLDQSGPSFSVTNFAGDTYTYTQCADCAVYGMDPPPTPEQLRSFYGRSYYGSEDSKFNPVMEKTLDLLLWWKAKKFWKLLGKKPAPILDVGCGNGRYLTLMGQWGCEIHGVEMEGPAYERSEQVPEIHLHKAPLSELDLPKNYFKLLSFWHVFEHVPNPHATLKQVHELLCADGKLIIEVPNKSSLQGRMFGKHWFHLDPPLHIFHYSRRSLERVLAQAGFSIARYETFSFEMGTYGFLQSLLNVFIRPRDLLYEMLRSKNRCPGPILAKAATLVLGLLFLPVTCLAWLIESLLGIGAVSRITCVKQESKTT